jgi:hypothetical protein
LKYSVDIDNSLKKDIYVIGNAGYGIQHWIACQKHNIGFHLLIRGKRRCMGRIDVTLCGEFLGSV